MRIQVDLDACQRHAGCCATAPQVFALDDAGLLTFVETPDEVYRAVVEDAADGCPTMAITVED